MPGIHPEPTRRYAAFISYSHADRRWALWLHGALERYRVPGRKQSGETSENASRARLSPIFLDREELSSSATLAEAVERSLADSDTLLVVCSPAAARSRWVNEEIRGFKALGRSSRIFCLVVAGDPVVLPGHPDACFPPALRFVVESGAVTDRLDAEPLAADVRPGMDSRRDAKLKLAAGILGVNLDSLRQRDNARRQRRLLLLASASAAACVVLATLTTAALLARSEAERQRKIAEQQSATAQRTADFLKSLFQVSDPGEARGNTITAREVLDRGARQIGVELRDQPAVRAELTTTLGEVYTGLGLYGSASELLASAAALPGQSEGSAVRQSLASAELETLRGNYAAAEALFSSSIDALRTDRPKDPALLARGLIGLGEVLASTGKFDAALVALKEGAEMAAAHPGITAGFSARGIEGLAYTYLQAGDLDSAERSYRAALEMRIAYSGEVHPKVSETLNSLGSIEYLRGNNAEAEKFFERALPIDQKVLGARHPDVAGTMNNLARVYLERRKFSASARVLKEAESIMLAEKAETTDDMTYVFSNLGLAEFGLGQSASARTYLEKALRAAVANDHRLRGVVLTDLANVECSDNKPDKGLQRLAEARTIVAARYPDDPWRLAWVDNVRGGCLLKQRRLAEAEQLLAPSTKVLLERWQPDTLYGHEAVNRMLDLYGMMGDERRLTQFRKLFRP